MRHDYEAGHVHEPGAAEVKAPSWRAAYTSIITCITSNVISKREEITFRLFSRKNLSDRVFLCRSTYMYTTHTVVTLDVKMGIFIQHLLTTLWTSTSFPIPHFASEFINSALCQEKKSRGWTRDFLSAQNCGTYGHAHIQKTEVLVSEFSLLCVAGLRVSRLLFPTFHKQVGCIRISFL
jgi:hypothetical protein